MNLYEFLGEEQIGVMKDDIAKVIVDRVKEDLDDIGELLIGPEDLAELANKALEEAKEEIKIELKKCLRAKVDAMIDNISK